MGYDIDIGDAVEWNWGPSTASGRVTKRFSDRVTLTINGTDVTRNATDDNPAYLIEQDDGSQVLKSASELTRV